MRVGVHIKTGPPTSQKHSHFFSIKELGWLHDTTASFDDKMSWEDAIRQHYGTAIDPNRYYVRRVRTDHGQPPHSLKEEIKVLMSDFAAKTKKLYSVQIMEFDEQVTLSSIGKKVSRVNRSVKRPIQKDETFRFSSTSTSARAPQPHQNRVDRDMPVLQPGGDGDYDYEDEELEQEVPVKRAKVQSQGHQRQAATSTSTPRASTSCTVQMRRVVPSASRSPAITNGGGGSRRNPSQLDPEEFKAQFYDRAKHSITNSQLLKARHALQQFKSSSAAGRNNQWTKWVLESPYAASILRTLFDV